MRLRVLLPSALVAAALTGCGIASFTLAKPSSSDVSSSNLATITGLGDGAFSLQTNNPTPLLATGEQAGGAGGPVTPPTGLTGVLYLNERFNLRLSRGTGVRLLVAGPARSDLVLNFLVGQVAQRIDSDPLAPDYTVESFVLVTQQDLDLNIRVSDYNQTGSLGLVRWCCWQLPSSTGSVQSADANLGRSGVTSLPGEFSFLAAERGQRLEVFVQGPAGSDLVLTVQVGQRQVEVDADPRSPDRRLEAFGLRVDDPARIVCRVENFDGSFLEGDVHWAVIKPPLDAARAPAERVFGWLGAPLGSADGD